ncbi:MAG: hypothetical protein JSS81_05990 [Acidobacteria bacterium]|nr:hypothetical protein [Acidobacteriota bacterium]
MKNQLKLTTDQNKLVAEFVTNYGLSEEQIIFDGTGLEPIFDFEALSVLRERLTDFQSVDVSDVVWNPADNSAQAKCTIITAAGRQVVVSDFAEIGESLPDNSKVESSLGAKRLARARAMRSGIRAAGVNLLKAHRRFLETGRIGEAEPVDPRLNKIREIHALAGEIGFIKGTDRTAYESHLAEMFEGRTSSRDLSDFELQRFVVSLRAIRRAQINAIADSQPAAA